MHDAADARPNGRPTLIRTAVQAWTVLVKRYLCTALFAGITVLWPLAARADTASCTVVLCLANPAGWAAVDECIAPVQAYFRSIRRHFRPPVCDESGATFSLGTRVIGTTKSDFGVEIQITETVLVMRNSDGRTQEFGGF